MFFTTLALCFFLTIAGPSIAAEKIIPEKPGLNLRGQRITGHEVIKLAGKMDKINFSVAKSVPDKKSWAFVCDELASGQIPDHVSFYWHGDNDNGWLRESNQNVLIRDANLIRSDTCWVTVYRPHSKSDRGKHSWRSLSEMRYHLALVDYFRETFGLSQFDVYGHSGGGTVAIAILQERRRYVRFAGLASPVLAVRKAFPYARISNVYDPYNRIKRLSFKGPEILPVCLLVVYDTRDKILPDAAVLPYFKGAKKRGFNNDQVRLVKVESRNYSHYHTTNMNLAQEIKKLKEEGGFCL